jgi:hypothetical protein
MAGQKIADGQRGTIRVPLALHTDMCLMTGVMSTPRSKFKLTNPLLT